MKLDKNALFRDFIIPFAVILLLSLLISLADFDRLVSGLFYQPVRIWPHGQNWLWVTLYERGMVPAFMLAGGGACVLLVGFLSKRVARFRRPAAFLLLMALVGPGLLVNVLGKDMWGRPRPVDTLDFGGDRPYHQFYQPAGPDMGKSFPSGHSSIGFYLIAPFFLLRRKRSRLALCALTLGTSYGILMSIGRMVQGGHYLTDVLWSAYLVYLSGMFFYYLLDPERRD